MADHVKKISEKQGPPDELGDCAWEETHMSIR
jgi:hypothetical protein